MKRRQFLATLAAASTISPSIVRAAEPEIFQTGGVAINGTDPVNYFNAGKPDSVMNKHSVSWKGVEWQFNTAENAEAFMATPNDFAPVFGGYCAYAASLGYLAPTVPEAWTIYEGKLYLNASLRARELWLQDIPGNIAKGQANWPGILG
ncbi:YHS domain-containing (seleno)protein [Actibacterium pelagium]|uniref:YHS domain-containing protein n=1 Tax=Actibacterium pelagium TaxID=2029103 RepID=A0A917AHZ8_9RHOB|nr:YHS domain-containing (seleno)protein [Actibacterium pelagium]GGE52076.1 hypothetical protein GCM10011517_19760 [Actibacterium pelagium]